MARMPCCAAAAAAATASAASARTKNAHYCRTVKHCMQNRKADVRQVRLQLGEKPAEAMRRDLAGGSVSGAGSSIQQGWERAAARLMVLIVVAGSWKWHPGPAAALGGAPTAAGKTHPCLTACLTPSLATSCCKRRLKSGERAAAAMLLPPPPPPTRFTAPPSFERLWCARLLQALPRRRVPALAAACGQP